MGPNRPPPPAPPAPPGPGGAAPVGRHDFVESAHRGTAVVTGPGGEVLLEVGDSRGAVLPRSSSKPLQAVAMVRSGLSVLGPHLALACASHSGEDVHLAGVREVLQGAGLTEADLQNTPDYPLDEAARIAWIATGLPKQSLAQNCSGKHAAMLATCAAAGWDIAAYRDPAHPLQQAITGTVVDLTGGPVSAVAVDGCGAPIHAVPLVGLAQAFGRLASAADGPEARVASAMRDHPEYVGGTGRDVTALIAGVPGLVAKDGAEAVYAAGLADGRGVAVKIADGGTRACGVVLAAVLRRVGITAAEPLAALETRPVLGHGEPVGAVVAVGL
ncbi:MAG: asparaginase [Intrasporangium sp.]|nr:asparaginase [Intrasporangium sp.]MDN5797319.1 asparaginase [Intrasporangium sp.]